MTDTWMRLAFFTSPVLIALPLVVVWGVPIVWEKLRNTLGELRGLFRPGG